MKACLPLFASMFLFLGSIHSYSFASVVYKVSKGEESIFIAGTIHVLSEADFPLPQAFSDAYLMADKLVFETDISATTEPSFQQKVAPLMKQADGMSLSDQLSKDTEKAFYQYLNSQGLPKSYFETLSATGVMLTLKVMKLREHGLTSDGVDDFFHNKALQDGKQIAWLEPVDNQLALLDNIDNGDPDALIRYTLESMHNEKSAATAPHEAWRSGDLNTLYDTGIKDFEKNHPRMYQDLMVARNYEWMQKIEKMFSNEEREYVLVGALHLAGEQGLLNLLSNKGYTISPL